MSTEKRLCYLEVRLPEGPFYEKREIKPVTIILTSPPEWSEKLRAYLSYRATLINPSGEKILIKDNSLMQFSIPGQHIELGMNTLIVEGSIFSRIEPDASHDKTEKIKKANSVTREKFVTDWENYISDIATELWDKNTGPQSFNTDEVMLKLKISRNSAISIARDLAAYHLNIKDHKKQIDPHFMERTVKIVAADILKQVLEIKPAEVSFDTLEQIDASGGGSDGGGGLHHGLHYSDLRLTSRGNFPVELQRPGAVNTHDMILWAVIERNANQYQEFSDFIDENYTTRSNSPFQGINSYSILRQTVRAWMLKSMSTNWDVTKIQEKLIAMYGRNVFSQAEIDAAVRMHFNIDSPIFGRTTEYLKEIYNLHPLAGPGEIRLDGVIRERLTEPPMCELIWSYWHEEGMMVQTMQAICLRFQNKLLKSGNDPLASLNTSPLRRLSNWLWQYINDEHLRLSVRRRNYEYDHHYGISLRGKAVADFQPADSRKNFMGAFNHLLYLLSQFYQQVDDTTVVADAFPIKNALRDVHVIMSEGAHNQFGDLPWAAREEMLTEKYILGRPEMREFLGGRSMVPYQEPWMENVDTMKRLQGWTDVLVQHFVTLANCGENILLSIRHGGWNSPEVVADNARNWADAHRSKVQEYIHSYRAITGLDLTDKSQVDNEAPAVHLVKKLEKQTGRPV
jgi:hypothetical protein